MKPDDGEEEASRAAVTVAPRVGSTDKGDDNRASYDAAVVVEGQHNQVGKL